jgi:hypothetical protein
MRAMYASYVLSHTRVLSASVTAAATTTTTTTTINTTSSSTTTTTSQHDYHDVALSLHCTSL